MENGEVVYDANNNIVYKPHESYEGLFVDGLTNYNSGMDHGGSPIWEIDIEGDAMGYGSYTLLNNLV